MNSNITTKEHPWRRYVALGDSFTEGVGDPDPGAPDQHRGWADRVAGELSRGYTGFAYANLAVRGKLLHQIESEQVDAALALQPDLVTLSAGGNDVIRPGSDPDALAGRCESVIERLKVSGATLVLFTGPDLGYSPVFRPVRGKIAIYNENLRAVAQRAGCVVVDLWALTTIQDRRMWAPDRLHLNPAGHDAVSGQVLSALGVQRALAPVELDALPHPSWRLDRTADLVWARSHLAPWLVRRIRHRSSGDHIQPKRPLALPLGITDHHVDFYGG